jgi:DNA-binding MarR family transcriptional regulator
MSRHPTAPRLAQFFESRSLGSPDNAVGFVLWRVVHRYQRDIDRALAPLDLTHLQFTTLMLVAWVARSGAIVAQSDIARIGDIHPMQVSLILKALEAKGHVTRTKSLANVRAYRVELTRPGLAVLEAALPLAIAIQRGTFGEDGRVGGPLLDMLQRVEAAQRALGDADLG